MFERREVRKPAADNLTSSVLERPPCQNAADLTLQPQVAAKHFSFLIRIVRNEEQLVRAVNIRAKAYERHWPNLYGQLLSPEARDRDPSSLIFLAEDKATGNPIGTMRVDTNLVSAVPFGTAIELPSDMQSSPIAYVTRLGVQQGSIGSLVKLALFKSLHRYCMAKQLAWMLVGVRPPGDRDYVRLGFFDLYEQGHLVSIGSSGGVPVRIMGFEVIAAERKWKESRNSLYDFMFTDYHPDIEIFSSVSGMWTSPRKSANRLREDVHIYSDSGVPFI